MRVFESNTTQLPQFEEGLGFPSQDRCSKDENSRENQLETNSQRRRLLIFKYHGRPRTMQH